MSDKILVCDDEAAIANIVKYNLEREKYEVEVAYDGEECLKILENNDYHYLMSLSEKINILKQWQFDYFYIIDFDQTVANLKPNTFLQNYHTPYLIVLEVVLYHHLQQIFLVSLLVYQVHL